MKNLLMSLVAIAVGFSHPIFAADTKETKEVKTETKRERSSADPNRIQFGVAVGLSFSNATYEPITSAASNGRTGFKAGVFAESPMIPGLLYFQPEFNFVQKGAESDHFGIVIPTRLNYLELPLMLKVKLGLPRIKPFAMAGPAFAYMLNASGENGATKVTSDNFSTVDVTMYLGAGLNFEISEEWGIPEIVFGMRYGFGVNDVDSGVGSWKSSSFQLTLGAQF